MLGIEKLMILSDSTLHLSQKGDANKFRLDCIECYTTNFYAKVVIEIIDGATAKELVAQIRIWIQKTLEVTLA